MDYGRIIRESFEIAWRYKSLWIFGLFAGGGFSGFNWNMNSGNEESTLQNLDQYGAAAPDLILAPIIMVGVLIGLVFLVMHLISCPALIDAVNRIKRGGGGYRLGESFSIGVDFFWRFLGLLLLYLFAGLVLIGVMAGIVIFLGTVHLLLAVLAALVLLPAALFIFFALRSQYALAQRALVVRGCRLADAVSEAYLLFQRNLSKNLVIFLIVIGLSIGIGIAAVTIWLAVGVPIALIALAIGLDLWPGLVLVMLLGLPVSVVMGGFTGTALENLYTLFYFDLVEPSAPAAPADRAPMYAAR
ncbi:MAG: hypothetical protein KAW91_01780 [candidate division Zixibacteria bacterium]|nr:hypothetical protein [candidate division Zixibacteria bacterium]